MQITNVLDVGTDFSYKWPASVENYPIWIEYRAIAEDGEHKVKIGFAHRVTYGKERIRATIWIGNHPHAEFFGADDFDVSGELLSEIKVHGTVGEVICRYPDNPIPERYTTFNTVGLPARVNAKGIHHAWAVVANVADHRTMISLAALRRFER